MNKRSRQQVKGEQINYLLADVEKILEEYKSTFELKERQLSDAQKFLVSAKQSYDQVSNESKELKTCIEKLKQHIHIQQAHLIENQQKYFKKSQKKYKRKPIIKINLKASLKEKKKKNKKNLKTKQ